MYPVGFPGNKLSVSASFTEMAKKRRPLKPKIEAADENVPTKLSTAKRPKRAVVSRYSKPSPSKVEDVVNEDNEKESVVEKVVEVKTDDEPPPDQPTEPANNEEEAMEVKTDGSKPGSDGSDSSSSDSDTSSDSDSDSSDSDSKSGTKEIPPAAVAAIPLVSTNNIPVKEYTAAKSSSSDSYHSDTEEEDKKRRKKQKNLQKQLLTKKPRRSISGMPPRSEMVEFEKDDDDDINTQCDGKLYNYKLLTYRYYKSAPLNALLFLIVTAAFPSKKER